MGRWLVPVAAAAAALVCGVAVGQARSGDAPRATGVVHARSYTVSYKMPFDVGVDGVWKPAERIDEVRQRVHVPQHLGELVTITPHGAADVLWYRSAEGVLRNVVIERVAEDLLHVETAPSREIDFTYR